MTTAIKERQSPTFQELEGKELDAQIASGWRQLKLCVLQRLVLDWFREEETMPFSEEDGERWHGFRICRDEVRQFINSDAILDFIEREPDYEVRLLVNRIRYLESLTPEERKVILDSISKATIGLGGNR